MITEIATSRLNVQMVYLVKTDLARQPGDISDVQGHIHSRVAGMDIPEPQPGTKEGSKANGEFLQALKRELDLINNLELKFNTDDETGKTYIKIVDKESGEVIREIPPEEVRKLAEKIDEMVGLLFDKRF